MSRTRRIVVTAALVGLGTAQMIADVLDLQGLKAIAAATQVSPAMKVFTAQRGYETYAARFWIGWQTTEGDWQELRLTPARYSGLRGPYNRRNMYGAAFAYGPLLRADPRTSAMHESVMRRALCNPAVVRTELGIPHGPTRLRVRIEPTVEMQRTDLLLTWDVTCHD